MSAFNEWIRISVVYPLAEKIKGANSMEWYHRIQTMNTWSRGQIQNWQEEQLHMIVHQAYYHTIYWKKVFDERGLKPEDICTLSDLQKLPILTKNDIRAHYLEIIPDNIGQFRSRKDQTGGTTGEPMKYLTDENQVSIYQSEQYSSTKF